MEIPNIQGLLSKVGVKTEVIKTAGIRTWRPYRGVAGTSVDNAEGA